MSATSATDPRAADDVCIVGVAWQTTAAVMAPFTAPRTAGRAADGNHAAALGAAALTDAGITTPLSAAKIFVVGDSAVIADFQTSAAVRVTAHDTVAAAVLSAIASLRAEPETECLIGAIGPAESSTSAWLVLATAGRARTRGVTGYAVLAATESAESAVGWLELPGGAADAPAATRMFVLEVFVLASAQRSAALTGTAEKGVRDALALVRAALALGHKILPFVRPNEPGQSTAAAAPLPWIHPLPLPGHPAPRTPRQAGWLATAADGRPVAFLLREDPAAAVRPDVVPFDQELYVFGADSPAALRHRLVVLHQRLGESLIAGEEHDLTSLAHQTLAALPSRPLYRLAIVSSSRAELDRQLRDLTAQLAPGTVDTLQAAHRPSSGIYCGSGLRGPESGTTAFLFPGLGASYPYMLGDLCLHFPAVREVFDSIDFVAAQLGEAEAPSQQVFLHPGRESHEPATAAAVITLLMAEWALAELLRTLGITPDALMGCSTGEFAALCQGGSIDEVAALPIIYRLSLGVARGLSPAQLAALQSVLVTAPAESLTPLFSAAPGPLYVSADLGTDCALLVGERPAVQWLLAALETRGIAAHVLPGGVPYHTPLLSSATVSGAAELSALTVLAPALPIWSCATARPYPADPTAILDDASVLFVRAIALRDTVEAMYQSGVRTFLEVGPGEGLGRRVGAILRGRPHVALASNLQQRTGMSQLLQLLAALHALGYPLQLAPLFQRRAHAASALPPQPRLPVPSRLPPLPKRQPAAALVRYGTALPALTLSLPYPERWFCIRIDHWELVQAGGSEGIDLSSVFSAAELLRAEPAPAATSLLTDWAAKRAVQGLIKQLTRREVALPAIELTATEHGETRASGDFCAWLGGAPLVAAAYCGDAAVALATTADRAVRLGIQLTKSPTLPVEAARVAVGRALGPAFPAAALQVAAVDPWSGWVALRAPGQPALLHARAVRLGAYFVTLAVFPRA